MASCLRVRSFHSFLLVSKDRSCVCDGVRGGPEQGSRGKATVQKGNGMYLGRVLVQDGLGQGRGRVEREEGRECRARGSARRRQGLLALAENDVLLVGEVEGEALDRGVHLVHGQHEEAVAGLGRPDVAPRKELGDLIHLSGGRRRKKGGKGMGERERGREREGGRG